MTTPRRTGRRTKQVYDEVVLAPMTELLADLKPALAPEESFRPYRDVRFSPDKSPYRTEIARDVGRALTSASRPMASALGPGTT